MLYNRRGKNREAEALLRDVLRNNPDMYDIHYSLGLLLAEEQKFAAAIDSLGQAARGLPRRPRVHYNLGLLLAQLRRDDEAEAALRRTIGLDPDNRQRVLDIVDNIGRRAAAGLIFVTHHAQEIPPCITHRLILEAGRVLGVGPV